jgi:hypothetical protein
MLRYENIIIQIVIGYFLADLLTGMVHWFEDSYLEYCIDLPIIGDIAKDNELHHYFPRSIIAYSYFEHMMIAIPMTLIVVGLLYFINRNMFKSYLVCVVSFAFFSSTANIVHRFSHLRDCETNIILKVLQKTGLFCSNDHHSIHHSSILNEKYCVISAYTNYILDRVYFWRFLEYLIYAFTKIEPIRKPPYGSYHEIQNHMHENAQMSCPDKPTRQDIDELILNLKKYKNCQ